MAIEKFVLVHGAWHGGWCWAKVARLLRDAGHEVYTPTLTGLGERAHLARPEVDLELHIQDLVAMLEAEELRQVTLVGHSYAGFVITGAILLVTQLAYYLTASALSLYFRDLGAAQAAPLRCCVPRASPVSCVGA